MGKTLVAVAEAAGTPNQSGPANARPATSSPTPPRPAISGPTLLPPPRDNGSPQVETPRHSGASSRRGAGAGTAGYAHRLKGSFWQPLAVFSAALWLRVTGTFFTLISFTMAMAAWRLRGSFRLPADVSGIHHLWLLSALTGVFGYFSVSSFVRASRRERQALAKR